VHVRQSSPSRANKTSYCKRGKAYAYTYTCACISMEFTVIYTYIHMHTHINIHTHTNTHTCIYTHTNTHTHTHINTRARAQVAAWLQSEGFSKAWVGAFKKNQVDGSALFSLNKMDYLVGILCFEYVTFFVPTVAVLSTFL
jgi:hypothetical protein